MFTTKRVYRQIVCIKLWVWVILWCLYEMVKLFLLLPTTNKMYPWHHMAIHRQHKIPMNTFQCVQTHPQAQAEETEPVLAELGWALAPVEAGIAHTYQAPLVELALMHNQTKETAPSSTQRGRQPSHQDQSDWKWPYRHPVPWGGPHLVS